MTDVDYNDGLANEVQSWDYDAAGNRSLASANPGTWTYDNLNRMSASPGVSYTHDAVGNRLTKVAGSSSTSYGWDAVNRMITAGPTTGTKSQYKYRADGMRAKKTLTGGEVTRSYYDGQMPIEEDVTAGGNTTLTRNFVGARGIEAMFTTANSATTAAYPLYDTHGNMKATLALNSGGTGWTIANERSYDVWGGVRSGVATGGPKGRYVANLGHVQDDESGLIYMRARYYEPETGRFVSEDLVSHGANWYTYCGNDPVNYADPTGGVREKIEIGGLIFDLDKGMHGWDLHVSDASGEIWSRFANGKPKHKNVNEKLGKILLAVADAVKGGNKSELAFLKKIFRAGGFGLGDDFAKMMSGVIGGIAIFAISSLDAYFQINPMCFMDTMLIISSGGQYGL